MLIQRVANIIIIQAVANQVKFHLMASHKSFCEILETITNLLQKNIVTLQIHSLEVY